MSNESWVTLQQVAEYLQVSEDTIHRWMAAKGLPAHRVGRYWRFRLSEVDAWVTSGAAAPKDDDVLWKETGCSSELDYTEQTSWLLFLKDLKQAMEADLMARPYQYLLDEAHRWSTWAATETANGSFDHDRALIGDDLLRVVNTDLFPSPSAAPRRPTPSHTRNAPSTAKRRRASPTSLAS